MPSTVWCARAPFVVRESLPEIHEQIKGGEPFVTLTRLDGTPAVLSVAHLSAVVPGTTGREETR